MYLAGCGVAGAGILSWLLRRLATGPPGPGEPDGGSPPTVGRGPVRLRDKLDEAGAASEAVPEVIRLKPHHWVDIMVNLGEGVHYAASNTGNAGRQVERWVRARREVPLELVLGPDDICVPCSLNVNGRCVDVVNVSGALVSKEEWNRTIDTRLLEKLGLAEGVRVSGEELCRSASEKFYPAGVSPGEERSADSPTPTEAREPEGGPPFGLAQGGERVEPLYDVWREVPREALSDKVENLLRGLRFYLVASRLGAT